MYSPQILTILLILHPQIFKFVNCIGPPSIDPTTFCYDEPSCGPKAWGGICETGKRQSPINIQTRIKPNYNYAYLVFNAHYSREIQHSFYAQNNGHTAQFELTSNTSALSSKLTICGGHLPDSYHFAQFHFHWGETNNVGSEHTLNGKRYPLELHLVHYKSTYSSLTDALESTDDPTAIAAISVLFNVGHYNRNFATIIKSLGKLNQPGNVTLFHYNLVLGDLYPSRGSDYARYLGSLTTPSCNQNVIWTVFLDELSISEGQMSQFRKLSNNEGNSDFNFRPIQRINYRIVHIYRNRRSKYNNITI